MTINATQDIPESPTFDPGIDHLVYGTPDLAATVADFAAASGLEPRPGGRHLGRGTRNFLVGLGPRRYLEIIGPDPENPPGPAANRPFGIDRLVAPRLVTWAVGASDIVAAVSAAAAAGADLGPVAPMSRRTPSGELLKWVLASTYPPPLDGVTPFLIHWGTSPHPAAAADLPAAVLIDLRATHPDPDRVVAVLTAMGVHLPVAVGEPGLFAVLQTPRGAIELR